MTQVAHYFLAGGGSLLPTTALTPDPTTEAVVLMTVPATKTVVDTTASATANTAQPDIAVLIVSARMIVRASIAQSPGWNLGVVIIADWTAQ